MTVTFSSHLRLSCVESFDDGLLFHPRPSLFLGILLSLVPHRLFSILNLMTRHDHGFLSRIPFYLPHKREMCSIGKRSNEICDLSILS